MRRQPLLDCTRLVRKLFLPLFQEEPPPLQAGSFPTSPLPARNRVEGGEVSMPGVLAGSAAPPPTPSISILPPSHPGRLSAALCSRSPKRGGLRGRGNPRAQPCSKSLPRAKNSKIVTVVGFASHCHVISGQGPGRHTEAIPSIFPPTHCLPLPTPCNPPTIPGWDRITSSARLPISHPWIPSPSCP